MNKLLLLPWVALAAVALSAFGSSGSVAEAAPGCTLPIYIDAVEVYSTQFSPTMNRFPLGHMERDRDRDGMPDPWLLDRGKVSQNDRFAFDGDDSMRMCGNSQTHSKRVVGGHAALRIEFRLLPSSGAVRDTHCLTIEERHSDYGNNYDTFTRQTYNMGSFTPKVFQKIVRNSPNPGASYVELEFTYEHC